mgnify:CR=1 FL=1
MITFKDFVPEVTSGPNIFGKREMEALKETQIKMNEWLKTEPNLKVLSIETLLLPNIHNPSEEGSEDPELKIPYNQTGRWYQIFRVWYKTW